MTKIMKYMISNLNKLLVTLLFCLVPLSMSGASVRLSVDMSRSGRSIGVGDIFYITYEVNDIDNAPDKPSSVGGAKVLYFDRTGQSSRFSSVNGKTTQSFTYIYTLTCKAVSEGSFSFGPVNVGGVRSNKVNYCIGKSSGPARQQGGDGAAEHGGSGPKFIGKGDGNLFLKANVSKTTAYEQEALVYTVKLYTTFDAIKFIGATSAPKFEGFVVEESKAVSQSLNYETYNGKTYATAVIARYIIFPQMSGTLNIKGNTYTVSVDEREYYADPIWGKMSVSKPMQLNVTPNDLSISVKALPLPRPDNFSGGVGKFTLSSVLADGSLKSNQAASVVYTVTGMGNLKLVKLPDLNTIYPKQIEVYSPTTSINTHVGSDNVSGSVKYDYSFMPLEPGDYKIPPVSLVYFNPSTGKYERTESRSYSLTVGKGKASAKSQTRDRLVFEKELLVVGHQSKIVELNIDSFVYWLVYIIPSVLFIIACLYYRYYMKVNSDMVALRSRKASKVASRRLKNAYRCMQKNDFIYFYDEMLSAIWGYIGDRLRISMSDLNRQNVRDRLIDRGVSDVVAEDVISLVDDCEYAKYSPVSEKPDMKGILARGENVINKLEEALKKK